MKSQSIQSIKLILSEKFPSFLGRVVVQNVSMNLCDSEVLRETQRSARRGSANYYA